MPPQEQQPPSPPPRLLALDPGEKRIGVALSDDAGMFAHPRPAIFVRSRAESLDAIASLVSHERVTEVIVGLPLTLEGIAAHQAERVRPFVAALRNRLGIPVREWDERLSSTSAARTIKKDRRRTGELDSAAAATILQAVLDSRRTRPL